jgi:hypothetical protein
MIYQFHCFLLVLAGISVLAIPARLGTVRVLQSAARSQGEALESFAKTRVALAERMTPDQISQAQRLAREWKPKTWDELKQGLETESR